MPKHMICQIPDRAYCALTENRSSLFSSLPRVQGVDIKRAIGMAMEELDTGKNIEDLSVCVWMKLHATHQPRNQGNRTSERLPNRGQYYRQMIGKVF
jgi:hypothetical protein